MHKHNITGAAMSDMAAHCTSCGECIRPCAFLQQLGTPAAIAKRGLSDANLLSAYGCSLCGLCDAVCPEILSPSAMFLAMRREAAARKIVDLKPYTPWLNFEKTGSSFLFRRDLIPKKCETVFFPGCSLPGSRPDAVVALLDRLRQMEPNAGLVLDCCGKISHDLGLTEQFATIFHKLANRLKGHGVKRILTSCPGCNKILQKYGDGFEITSIYEALTASTTNIAPTDPTVTVSIHDPCPSRFDKNQQQAVRRLVQSCGYTVEETLSSGVNTRCCGQGGMVEGCVPGTVKRESGYIAVEADGRPLITSCGACCDTLSAVTPTAHVADLLTGTAVFSTRPASSARRWLNRLKLRFARLL